MDLDHGHPETQEFKSHAINNLMYIHAVSTFVIGRVYDTNFNVYFVLI